MKKKYLSLIEPTKYWLALTALLISTMMLTNCTLNRTAVTSDNGVEPVIEGHPALLILEQYKNIAGKESVLVVPYFTTLMAIDLLRLDAAQHRYLVKAYLNWYIAHLNYPDKYGITGSIYDWRVYADESEISTYDMDSVDSYSATFIMLVNRYLKISGDRNWVETHRRYLEDIIYHIPHLQTTDHLTVAHPDTNAEYLMDNCEALGGTAAMIELSGTMYWFDLQNQYIKIHDQLAAAIETHLYDGDNQLYFWAKIDDKKSASQWDVFYPDAYAQLFPILYKLTGSSRSNRLWTQFHNAYGNTLNDELSVEQRIVYEWTKEVIENENYDQSGHTAGGD